MTPGHGHRWDSRWRCYPSRHHWARWHHAHMMLHGTWHGSLWHARWVTTIGRHTTKGTIARYLRVWYRRMKMRITTWEAGLEKGWIDKKHVFDISWFLLFSFYSYTRSFTNANTTGCTMLDVTGMVNRTLINTQTLQQIMALNIKLSSEIGGKQLRFH